MMLTAFRHYVKPHLRPSFIEGWSCASESETGHTIIGYGSAPFLAYVHWQEAMYRYVGRANIIARRG